MLRGSCPGAAWPPWPPWPPEGEDQGSLLSLSVLEVFGMQLCYFLRQMSSFY